MSGRGGVQQLTQRGVQQRQHRLGLRIAEADRFDHCGPTEVIASPA